LYKSENETEDSGNREEVEVEEKRWKGK